MPRELATKIAGWMRSRQKGTNGKIVDSVHRLSGHYADGFAALTFFLLGWQDCMETALDASTQNAARSEFDQLALTLLLRIGEENLPLSISERLRCIPIRHESGVVSNNWSLFRALNAALRDPDTADFSLTRCRHGSGLFVDSPSGEASPVCYHAKICSVLALTVLLSPEHSDPTALLEGVDALLQLVSPQGLLAPYGRSRGSLFAYGSAYLSFRLCAKIVGDGRFTWAAERILQFLVKHQTPDGHLPAILNDQEWLRNDWDIYVNNPDYNAYLSACLMLAEKLAPTIPEAVQPQPTVRDLGPLLVYRGEQNYFVCSTRGEFAPYSSPFFYDTRYAGLCPLLFDNGVTAQEFDSPYCWDGRESTRACLTDPRRSPWTPYLKRADGLYWVQVYTNTEWALDAKILTIKGKGQLCKICPAARTARFIGKKFLRRPVAEVRVEKLRGQELFSQLEVDFALGSIKKTSHWDQTKPSLVRANLEAPLCTR